MKRQLIHRMTVGIAALALTGLLGACSDGANVAANGASGNAGLTTLFSSSASTNCANGGVKLDFGLDDDRDGILDVAEIDGSTDVCNGSGGATGSGGSNGLAMLFKTTGEAAGANCANGGIKLDSGLDANANGTLDPAEITSAPAYVCNGAVGGTGTNGSDGVAMLYQSTVEAAGPNCTYGGYRFVSWRDVNPNSTLDPAEVATSTTSYVCNGATGTTGSNGTPGANGIAMLFSTLAEPVGVNCTSGGLKLVSWLDTNGSGTLDGTEVAANTNYVCNGATGSTGNTGGSGMSMAFLTVAEPAGLQCLNGGLRIDMGLDDNANGVLDAPAEIDTTRYICNGVDATSGSNSGSVVMGPVKGAKICADLNANGICDPTEPFAYSSSVPGLEGKFIVRGIPAGTNYKLITEGGIDSLSGRPALPLQAPKGAANITPITTLVAKASDPAALSAVLDNLSGGVGYDVDFSANKVSSALLALNKSLEAFCNSMAGIGLNKPVEQAALLQLVATQMVAQPTANLGNIFSQVAMSVAGNPAQLNPAAPPQLAVTDQLGFATSIKNMVTSVETTVAGFGAAVQETQALQNAIEILPQPDFSASTGTVTVKAGNIAVYNAANALVATMADGSSTTLPASNFKKVTVSLTGVNTYAPVQAQSYPNASFTLSVADKNSERSLKLTVDGLTVTVATNGAVTVATGAASKLYLEGRNKTGDVLVNTSLTTFTNPVISGSTIQFDIPALEAQLNGISGGSIVASGDFTIGATALNLPGTPAAVELTLN